MSRDALVIGLNSYQHIPGLKAPAHDAEAIANALTQYGGFRVWRLPERVDPHDGSLHISHKRGVSLTELKEALVRLFKPTGDQCPETALFFFSGHGIREDQGIQEGFLATSDANPAIGFHGLSLQWLRRLLQESPVQQQVVWLDCCYGGELLNFQASLQEADPGSTEQRDRCFIAACRAFEVSYEQAIGNHSVFTHALLRGLEPGQRLDGWVTNNTLTQFINDTLATETQCPIIHNSGRAIVLATDRAQPVSADAAMGNCPYKALAYFEEKDAPCFYGRTALTDQLIQRVQQNSFVAVIGPSGSGKSSVLRAGLLHQLKLGQRLAGSHAWKYLPPFTPGAHPADHLEQALGVPLANLRQFATMLPTQRVVMVIDQFEECFTLCEDQAERQRFLSGLFSALEEASPKLCLILGMRADFLGCCMEYRNLAVHLEHAVTVKPMSSVELEEAIAEPARRLNVQVEPQLVHRMIEDVMNSPGSLPLLQFSLTALWETRQAPFEGWLTLAAYQQIGGIKGTLEKAANAAFDRLTAEEQTLAKRIFLELTQPGVEDTRRPVRRQDLVIHADSELLLNRVIRKLVAARLIVVDRADPDKTSLSSVKIDSSTVIVDVAHEALIRYWQRLQGWLNECRAILPQYRELEAAALAWSDRGRPENPAFLLRGARLDAAEHFMTTLGDLLPPAKPTWDYIQTSIRQRRRSRRFMAGAIAVFVTGLASAALVSTAMGIRATDRAIESMAKSAINLLQSGDPIKALFESLKAGHTLERALWSSHTTRLQTLTALQESIHRGRESNRLEGHAAEVYSLDVSRDGSFIASGGWDHTVRLWRLDGTLLWSQEHTAPIMGVSFSPDGTTVAVGDVAGEVRIWQAEDGSLVETITNLNSATIRGVQFSPDGERVAIASSDSTVRLWHLRQNRWIEMAAAHDAGVARVQFSPDGTWLASASDDGAVMLWDAASGERLATFDQHSDIVTSLAISPDGQTLASGDRTGQIYLWQWQSPSPQLLPNALFESLGDAVASLHFSPDGQQLVAGDHGGNVRLFQTDGILMETFAGHGSDVRAVAFHPSGNLLLSAGNDGTIRLWQLRRNWHERPVYAVSFSPDGTRYASASGDGTLKLWDRQTHTLQHTLTHHRGTVQAVSFSPDGEILASASAETLKLWNATDGRLLNTLEGHKNYVHAVAFSPDGTRLASAGDDGTVRIWDRQSGQLLHTLTGHADGITSLGFHPYRPLLASGSWDGTAKVWNLTDARLEGTREVSQTGVTSVAFSPDGHLLATSTADGEIQLWDGAGDRLQAFQTDQGYIPQIVFHPDGQTLVSAGANQQIKFWSMPDGDLIETLSGHQATVTSLAFSPDGTLMVSGSDDQSLIPWTFELDLLLQEGCDRLANYLENNSWASEQDDVPCL